MIPVLHVVGKNLPETYERSVLELYRSGERIKTQYDNPNDPPSIDATMNITVEEPESDPMIYKLFPGGIEDLREYVMELQGAKDHWVKCINDSKDTRWEYTYHQRLADWGTYYTRDIDGIRHKRNHRGVYDESAYGVNQLETMVRKLTEAPYTRRAQAITWMPFLDNEVYDPPCLQSIWCRLTEEEDATLALNTNIRFRSNDAWGAAFMNMFGITMMIRDRIANPIQKQLNRKVKMGRLNWQADSYHIYGKDRQQFVELVIKSDRDFEDSVYNFHDKIIQDIWNETEEKVRKKIELYDKEHKGV